ncbi:MAG TPA: hypothetical protein DD420_10840 [Streptomyces sp.]|nr:hypothetical protein [Streptomyces sp.]
MAQAGSGSGVRRRGSQGGGGRQSGSPLLERGRGLGEGVMARDDDAAGGAPPLGELGGAAPGHAGPGVIHPRCLRSTPRACGPPSRPRTSCRRRGWRRVR